jgi:hypothetical protein
MKTSWDRQADETEEWYDRFMLYLYMGPNRTVSAAHSFAVRLVQGAKVGQLGTWQGAARRQRWKARAAEFDAELRRKALAAGAKSGEPARDEGRDQTSGGSGAAWTDDQRRQMVAELLHQVYGVLRHADLLTLSKEEARQLLPTFRLFFRDLLRLHQSEVAQLLAGGDGKEGTELNADVLVRFMTDEVGVQSVVEEIKRFTDPLPKGVKWQPLRDALAQLYPDEASARRIAAQAHLDGTRIQFSGRAVDGWHSILGEAMNNGRMESLIEVVSQEYGANEALVKAMQIYRRSLEKEGEPTDFQQSRRKEPVKKARVRKKA